MAARPQRGSRGAVWHPLLPPVPVGRGGNSSGGSDGVSFTPCDITLPGGWEGGRGGGGGGVDKGGRHHPEMKAAGITVVVEVHTAFVEGNFHIYIQSLDLSVKSK